MKRILIIVVTFFTVMSFAQTQQQKPSELVAQQKTLGAEFQKVQIFSPVSQQKNSIQTPKGLDDYMLFSVDQRAMKSMQGGYPATMNLEIPGQKSALSVDLVKVTITTDDFQAIDMPSGRVLPRDNTAHYRGVVKGKSNSLVAISFFGNKIAGFISIDGEKDNLVVGPVKTTENHILYRDGQMSYLYELACDVEDDLEGYTKEELADTPQNRAAAKCPRIFFDIGTDIVNDKGGSQQASNYVEALFNQAAALYANDQISIKLSGTKAWASNQPFSSDLNSYINYKNRTGLNGDLGHCVTYGYSGGVAGGIGTLCNSSRKYAISGIKGRFSNIPTYSFDVFLISHEMGHNLGSRHTHACVWNGNNTAIDGCAGRVEGNCRLPGNPAGGGTIMSYCPNTSVGVNFNKGFGSQPRNVIRNYIDRSSCLQTCGGGGCSPGDAVSVTFSNNTNCTLQYYNNNALQGSANAGRSFTANTTIGSTWQARQTSGATVDDFTIICDQTTYTSSGTCGGGGGSCSGLPQYAAGTSYRRNQEVQNVGEKFKCDVPGWCSSSAGWAYAPGTGYYWQYAWSKTGTCSRASITFKEDASAGGLNFTIYPNPVRDQLNIEFNNLKPSSGINVSIKDMNGRILETDQLKALSKGATVKKSMDVSDLPKGIYFVQITIGSKVVTQKIFIE